MRNLLLRLARPLAFERHPLGPRVYVFGMRIHEVTLGLVVLAGVLVALGVDVLELGKRTEALSVFGTWLVVKDWRDLVPSQRNTARWSLLPHRPPRHDD